MFGLAARQKIVLLRADVFSLIVLTKVSRYVAVNVGSCKLLLAAHLFPSANKVLTKMVRGVQLVHLDNP